MTVVTRFAPSPTGFLHIGGVRTAIFNWLYARHHSGRFLLRIEDTDKARSTPEAVKAIFDGLKAMGMDADAPALFQSQQTRRHVEIVEQLLAEAEKARAELGDQLTEREGTGLREPGKADWGDE